MSYRIYFTNGLSEVLDPQEFDNFLKRGTGTLPENIRSARLDENDRWFSVNANHITHIVSEPEPLANSNVVTPPSPAQLRNDKEKEENKAITLDTLLESK